MDRKEGKPVSLSKRCIYIDAFSGISGDMLIAGLLGIGARVDTLRAAFDAMAINAEIHLMQATRCGISARRVVFHVEKEWEVPRRLCDFLQVIQRSRLPRHIQEGTRAILTALFEAEARAHGVSIEEVHLHELGSYDTLLDIVGVLAILDSLEIEAVYSSPIPVPRGLMEGSHGPLPIPAPAVAHLMTDVRAYGVEIDAELVTPTGIAIVKHLANSFGPFPDMVVRSVGYGAGARDLVELPNMVRIWFGEQGTGGPNNQVTELVTVVDDLSGEILGHAQKVLLEKGALDCYITPVVMKKGRPGYELHVLSPLGEEERLLRTIFMETSTIGVRLKRTQRVCLPREASTRKTPWGTVKVKEVEIPGRRRAYTEYESAARVSEEKGVPLIEIYRAVER